MAIDINYLSWSPFSNDVAVERQMVERPQTRRSHNSQRLKLEDVEDTCGLLLLFFLFWFCFARFFLPFSFITFGWPLTHVFLQYDRYVTPVPFCQHDHLF